MVEIHENIVKDVERVPQYPVTYTWSASQTVSGIALVISVYLILVKWLVPYYMKSKPPFKLKKILLTYNGFQAVFSAYLVSLYSSYIFNFSLITTRCSQGEDLQMVINKIYPYFIATHLNLLETVFFALRKKDNHVTFLHLYHHTTMVTWAWFNLMCHPCDHFVAVGMLNSFFNVLTYTYTGIASLEPKYGKYILWKKNLTKVQLVQFILVSFDLYYQQKLSLCPIPAFFHYVCMAHIGSYFVLFIKFYTKNYKNKKNREEQTIDSSLLDDRLAKMR